MYTLTQRGSLSTEEKYETVPFKVEFPIPGDVKVRKPDIVARQLSAAIELIV